jgi:hypothetical protein
MTFIRMMLLKRMESNAEGDKNVGKIRKIKE